MKYIKNKVLALSILVATLSGQAFALTSTAPLQATATLNPSCRLSTQPVAFGVVTPAPSGELMGRGSVNVTCSNGTSFTLSFNGGSTNNITDRKMNGSNGNTDKLSYNLYNNPFWDVLLGDGTVGLRRSYLGTGGDFSETIFARLFLNQYVKADNYTDNLIVTLEY